MRAIRTSNGPAVPFRIDYRLTRWELVAALAWQYREPEEALPHLTNGQVVGMVRDTLRYAGDEAYASWRDHLSEQDTERIETWASEHVDRVFGKALSDAC